MIKLRREAGHIAHMGQRRGVYKVLVGKHEGKRPLGRLRCVGGKYYNGSSGSGKGDMDWIDLAQDMDRWRTLINAVKNFRVS